jgi:DNA invertase Pin-like site-specific DNA recombinase
MPNTSKQVIKVAVYCRLAVEPQHTQQNFKTTALYSRTATRSDFAIQSQLERLYRYAEEKGYENIVSYSDNGEVGTTLDRPAMNQLIADIRADKVQTVIVANTDRIARDIALLGEAMTFLEDAGVDLIAMNWEHQDLRKEFAFWCGFLGLNKSALKGAESISFPLVRR